MINKRTTRDYCKKYWKIENYEEAKNSAEKWQCHHRLEFMPFSKKKVTVKYLQEQHMYYNVEPSALIFLPTKEHRKLHMEGNKIGIGSRKGTKTSEETKKKISESKKGCKPNVSDEVREKRRQFMIWMNKNRKNKK